MNDARNKEQTLIGIATEFKEEGFKLVLGTEWCRRLRKIIRFAGVEGKQWNRQGTDKDSGLGPVFGSDIIICTCGSVTL